MTDHHSPQGYLLVSGAAFFWAFSGVLAKHLFSSRPIGPLILVEFRLIFAFLTLALALAALSPGELRIDRTDLFPFAVYGFFGMALVQVTYFVAIAEGTVSTAIFLQYLAPLLTAGYETVAGRRLPSRGLLASLLLATCGSALLLLAGGGGLATSRLGLAAGLASAASFSFYTIYGSRVVTRYGPRTSLLWATGTGALALAPLARPWQVAALGWAASDWLFLLYLGTFGTLVPFTLFLAGLRHLTPVQATLTAMLEPVVATGLAWVLLAEALGGLQVAGGALIIVAVAGLQAARQRRAGARGDAAPAAGSGFTPVKDPRAPGS